MVKQIEDFIKDIESQIRERGDYKENKDDEEDDEEEDNE